MFVWRNTHALWSVPRNWTLQLLCLSVQCSGNGQSRPWWCFPHRRCQWSGGCSRVWWLSWEPPVRWCPVRTETAHSALISKVASLCSRTAGQSSAECLSPSRVQEDMITHQHTQGPPPSPAVSSCSRQMGDSCSLEIFLHYCHQGTSLNVCFQAPVLMRTCLLKWWSTWQRPPPHPTHTHDHHQHASLQSWQRSHCRLCSEPSPVQIFTWRRRHLCRLRLNNSPPVSSSKPKLQL